MVEEDSDCNKPGRPGDWLFTPGTSHANAIQSKQGRCANCQWCRWYLVRHRIFDVSVLILETRSARIEKRQRRTIQQATQCGATCRQHRPALPCSASTPRSTNHTGGRSGQPVRKFLILLSSSRGGQHDSRQARSAWAGGWTILGGQIREFAPTGLEDSAQGFNPGNRHPDRYALKGRQIQRTNKVKAESNCCTSRLRI
jgi:hypothetical protein